MSSRTDSLFGQITKGFGLSSENPLLQALVGLIAEPAWEKANIKAVAVFSGGQGKHNDTDRDSPDTWRSGSSDRDTESAPAPPHRGT